MLQPVVFFLVCSLVSIESQSMGCDQRDIRTLMVTLSQMKAKSELDDKDIIRTLEELSTDENKKLDVISTSIRETSSDRQKILRDLNSTLNAVIDEKDTLKGHIKINLKAVNEHAENMVDAIDGVNNSITSLTSTLDGMTQSLRNVLSEINNIQGLTQRPDGWMSYNRSCYLFNVTEKSFLDASNACNDFRAHLVYVEGEAENNFLKGIVAKMKVGLYWMGLTDVDIEGTWLLVDKNTEATFFDWSTGEPNNVLDEDCAQFWSEDNFYRWNDDVCSRQYFFICERDFGL